MQARLILLLMIFLSPYGNTCEITLPERIIVNKKITSSIIEKEVGCDANIQKKLITFLNSSKGSIRSDHIKKILEVENLQIIPEKISITSLNHIINKEIQGLTNKEFKLDKIETTQGAWGTSKQNVPLLQTKAGKLSLGFNRLEVIIGDKRIYPVSWLAKKQMVLAAKKDLRASTRVSLNDMIKTYRYSQKDLEAFQKPNKLSNYTLIKSLKAGDYLKRYDLRERSLVTRNSKVTIEIEGQHIFLSTSGIARSSGKLNDFINIKNIKTQKEFRAKVIGENKVELKL